MRSRRLCLVLFLSLLASARLQSQAAPSPAQPAASPEEIEALMRQSGLQGLLSVLPAQLEDAVLQKDSGLDPKRVYAFRAAMATAFASDRIQGRARDLLRSRLGHEDAEQVAQWYSSPLGKKIRELELKSGKPETYANKQGDLAKIVGAERLKRIERIESAVQTAEAIFLWTKHSGTSAQKAKFLVWGVDMPLPTDITERIAQLRPTFHRIIILSSADTLRSLKVEDLDRYVNFVETPSARRWYRAMWDALDLVMAEGMEEVVAAMPKISK